MPTKKSSVVRKPSLNYALIGGILYFFTIIIFAFNPLRIQNPTTFSVALVLSLLISGIGFGYAIAGDAKNVVIRLLGTVGISVIFVFPGYLVTALMGWMISVTM